MVYEYKVKHKGKWYMPGENVPEEDDISTSPGAYTKTDINRMSTADLQALAAEHGIDGAEEISGAELKRILIEQFGL